MCFCASAYSRSNENETLKKKLSLNVEPEFNVRHLNKPFKINKLNLIWSKAKQVSLSTYRDRHSFATIVSLPFDLLDNVCMILQKCSEPELRSLLSELRIQDEDERELKIQKTKNLDKDGEMESIVRKKLLGEMTFDIWNRYYLSSI